MIRAVTVFLGLLVAVAAEKEKKNWVEEHKSIIIAVGGGLLLSIAILAYLVSHKERKFVDYGGDESGREVNVLTSPYSHRKGSISGNMTATLPPIEEQGSQEEGSTPGLKQKKKDRKLLHKDSKGHEIPS
jgi:hypothetical protein